MTLENCKRLLEHFEACKDDSSLTQQARLNAKNALADMKAHLAKYRGVQAEPKPVLKSKK